MASGEDLKELRGFRLGGVEIRNRVVLGPMAGFTDLPFRLLAWESGMGLAYTEMVSAMALVYQNQRTGELLRRHPSEGPVSVQLFGHEPGVLAQATALVLGSAGEPAGALPHPVAIDLNAGCPTPKIVRNGEGSALMRDLDLLGRIVQAMAEAAAPYGVPVTVKIRAGWDAGHRNAVAAARAAERAGAALVAVHGRTRDQFYHGRADWSIIKAVREGVGIPVVGNGDVACPEDALAMCQETGCDAVMIARGALGNPWLLGRAAAALAGRPVPPPPTPVERLDTLLRHLRLEVDYLGEEHGVREMRKHLAWYLKGLPCASPVKQKAQTATTLAGVTALLEDFRATLAAS